MHRAQIFIAVLFMLCGTFAFSQSTQAQCQNCIPGQCGLAVQSVPSFHNGGFLPFPFPLQSNHEGQILEDWRDAFSCYRSWLVGHDSQKCRAFCANKNARYPDAYCSETLNPIPRFWEDTVLNGLMVAAEQMSAVAMHSSMMIGQIFDAKAQLETQRLLQEKQFEAHRDYQPSEAVCYFGSATQSMAKVDQDSETTRLAFNKIHLNRALGSTGTASANSVDVDKRVRWDQFRKNYCDPKDNNWKIKEDSEPYQHGLYYVCGNTISPAPNADIDYTKLYLSGWGPVGTSGDRKNYDQDAILALSNNLYGHNVLPRRLMFSVLETAQGQQDYFQLRSVVAKRAVALNSYDSIAALKRRVQSNNGDVYDKLYSQLGLNQTTGGNISDYLRLEALASKAYQNPVFIANLYDKPANVSRMSTAMKAVNLMLDRRMFESELRQEMILSVLLSTRQNDALKEIDVIMGNAVAESVGSQ